MISHSRLADYSNGSEYEQTMPKAQDQSSDHYCEIQCGHVYNIIEDKTVQWMCGSGQTKEFDYPITAQLEGESLWSELKSHGNEMVVSRIGKRMFPNCNIRLNGLLPTAYYHLVLEALPISRLKFEYDNGKWVAAGPAQPESDQRIYTHPETPLQGAGWIRKPASFKTVKFTTGERDGNQIVVKLGQKYVLRLHLVELSDQANTPNRCATFVFRETEFITVNAYKNEIVAAVKMNRSGQNYVLPERGA